MKKQRRKKRPKPAKAEGRTFMLAIPPNERKPEVQLRRTNGRERQHRDRGHASNSDRWSQHVGECRD